MMEYYMNNMLALSVKPPTIEEVKKLTVTDIPIMSALADFFRDSLKKHVKIDPYTVPDPFANTEEYDYLAIVDKEKPARIVAIMALIGDQFPKLPWDNIVGRRLIKLPLSKQDASTLKYELMPKDTNNFYPFRQSGKIGGCVMFAFQICGQR